MAKRDRKSPEYRRNVNLATLELYTAFDSMEEKYGLDAVDLLKIINEVSNRTIQQINSITLQKR